MLLTKKGHIYSFGYGVHGQLGLGISENMLVPKKAMILADK